MRSGVRLKDYGWLLKLRLIVARHGEMDRLRWWNTDGVLSHKGATLIGRGLPKTHRFARARIVFEVARSRSQERFPALPNCATLWNLPAEIEDAFDERWPDWLDDGDRWNTFIDELDTTDGDLLAALRSHGLLTADQEQEVQRMRRSAEERAVQLSGLRNIDENTITLLAAGFARGEVGKLAVPYVRLEG